MNNYEILKKEIKKLAKDYRDKLNNQIGNRLIEMQKDDNSHFLIYRVLGITSTEGSNIDIYQNKGRFLYKYAGSFLEEATILCFKNKFTNAEKKVMVDNNIGNKPKRFEIDCLVNNNACEIKWRDATTDGDHITKEHTRIKVISSYGYKPVRIMFYYPNRDQAIRIQRTLETLLYHGIGGEYYFGESAWEYVKNTTGVDLLSLLEELANEVENEQNH